MSTVRVSRTRIRLYTLAMKTLSTREAAAILELLPRTVCQYVGRGLLRPLRRKNPGPGVRYEFTRAEIDRFRRVRKTCWHQPKSRRK